METLKDFFKDRIENFYEVLIYPSLITVGFMVGVACMQENLFTSAIGPLTYIGFFFAMVFVCLIVQIAFLLFGMIAFAFVLLIQKVQRHSNQGADQPHK